MRVLIAPEAFDGTLTAGQAAHAIASGWAEHAPDDVLDLCPLSDGGPGFVEVLHAALGGRLLPSGSVLLVDATAYLDTAGTCARTGTTAGVAQHLRAAVDAGARRIVVGVGGPAPLDGGAAMLAALGAGAPDVLDALPDVRAALAGVDLVAATDVDAPLLGVSGPAGPGGPDDALVRYVQTALDVLGTDLAPQRLVAAAGSGAAGGLGFALMLLGARREIGTQVVLDAVGLPDRLARSDLVVTGEGTLDWRSLRGKVVAGVARAALAAGVPAVVLAGQVEAGRRELLSAGVESAYAVAETPQQVRAALADPAGTLGARARRIARTWSRRP